LSVDERRTLAALLVAALGFYDENLPTCRRLRGVGFTAICSEVKPRREHTRLAKEEIFFSEEDHALILRVAQ
jgi:hypothetical protein